MKENKYLVQRAAAFKQFLVSFFQFIDSFRKFLITVE